VSRVGPDPDGNEKTLKSDVLVGKSSRVRKAKKKKNKQKINTRMY